MAGYLCESQSLLGSCLLSTNAKMLMEKGYGRFCSASHLKLNANIRQLSKLKVGLSVSDGSEWISAVLCPPSAVCQAPAGDAAASHKAILKPQSLISTKPH